MCSPMLEGAEATIAVLIKHQTERISAAERKQQLTERIFSSLCQPKIS